MAQVHIGTRLARYGLQEAQVNLADLRLAPNQRQTVSHLDPSTAGRAIRLQPHSVTNLKAWIGIPDSVASQPGAASLKSRLVVPPSIAISSLGDTITHHEHDALAATTHAFVFGNSAAVNPTLTSTLDNWLTRINPVIVLVPFNDIYLSAGSQLVIDQNTFVLFARYITVEETATILLQGTATSIDCAGFESVPIPVEGSGGGGGGGGGGLPRGGPGGPHTHVLE